MRILLIEDDRRLVAGLRRGLVEAGWAVDAAYDGQTGLGLAEATPYDVILLDVMLPVRDGLSVCTALRRQGRQTPVLMLTARDTVDDRVAGLEAGADDYLLKPFAFRELLARVRALTRRPLASRSRVLKAGDLRVDTDARRCYVRETEVPLTAKEFGILEYFVHHPGRLLTRRQIEDHLWDYAFVSGSNVVDVHIKRIRRKLRAAGLPDPIVTLRGSGYRLEASHA
ncbi:MAG TPA: response regulator transcription factor [Candidatus Dormibacteraeota bacterium]